MIGKQLIYNVRYRSCYLCGYDHNENRKHRNFCKIFGNQCCENCYDLIKGKGRRGKFRSSIFLSLWRINMDQYMKMRRPNHPRADNYGFVLEHILVMEDFISKQLGCRIYISNEWDIHHKNGNTIDNNIKNLQLMTHIEHIEYHKRLYYLSLKHSTLLFDLG